MTEKVLCPYCGAEMRICVAEYSFKDYMAWTECTSNKCAAEGPLVVRNSEDKARDDAIAAALRRYTPPIRPMALEEAREHVKYEDATPVWCEDNERNEASTWILSRALWGLLRIEFSCDDYGKTWRCWKRKPTEKEMREAEWKK